MFISKMHLKMDMIFIVLVIIGLWTPCTAWCAEKFPNGPYPISKSVLKEGIKCIRNGYSICEYNLYYLYSVNEYAYLGSSYIKIDSLNSIERILKDEMDRRYDGQYKHKVWASIYVYHESNNSTELVYGLSGVPSSQEISKLFAVNNDKHMILYLRSWSHSSDQSGSFVGISDEVFKNQNKFVTVRIYNEDKKRRPYVFSNAYSNIMNQAIYYPGGLQIELDSRHVHGAMPRFYVASFYSSWSQLSTTYMKLIDGMSDHTRNPRDLASAKFGQSKIMTKIYRVFHNFKKIDFAQSNRLIKWHDYKYKESSVNMVPYLSNQIMYIYRKLRSMNINADIVLINKDGSPPLEFALPYKGWGTYAIIYIKDLDLYVDPMKFYNDNISWNKSALEYKGCIGLDINRKEFVVIQ